MEKLLWHFQSSSGFELLGTLALPIIIGLLLYHSSYVPILIRAILWRVVGRPEQRLPEGEAPSVLVIMPTLLRHKGELEGLKRAMRSVLDNGYPGELVLCAAIDEANGTPRLFAQLRRWLSALEVAPNVTKLLAASRLRVGKAVAIEAGVQEVKAAVARGDIPAFPTLVMSMDADSKLSQRAMERLAWRITQRGRISRQYPMITASNIYVAKEHYWKGWRGFFTVRGQLALQVAREYLTSISLARNNWRFIPVTSVSGALYCTWSELFLQGPKYASFMRTLRFRDLVTWWFGAPPPSFAKSTAEPLPEAMTGPGDDTWVAWLALSSRWRHGKLTLELPRTPLHAFWNLIWSYIFRPVSYVSAARVFTKTPTTIKGLYRQRIRWNSSRIWLLHRYGWSSFFNWGMGFAAYLDIGILVAIHGVIVIGLILFPIAGGPTQWLAIFIIINIFYAAIRAVATLLAMLQDGDLLNQWHKLLAVPFSGPYHIVFNISTTIVGFIHDLFLNGVNTNFAPESTLIRAGTGRVALAYRFKRAFRLLVRAAIRGDVRFGAFWFGWHETPWTHDGYYGWTDPDAKRELKRKRWWRRKG